VAAERRGEGITACAKKVVGTDFHRKHLLKTKGGGSERGSGIMFSRGENGASTRAPKGADANMGGQGVPVARLERSSRMPQTRTRLLLKLGSAAPVF